MAVSSFCSESQFHVVCFLIVLFCFQYFRIEKIFVCIFGMSAVLYSARNCKSNVSSRCRRFDIAIHDPETILRPLEIFSLTKPVLISTVFIIRRSVATFVDALDLRIQTVSETTSIASFYHTEDVESDHIAILSPRCAKSWSERCELEVLSWFGDFASHHFWLLGNWTGWLEPGLGINGRSQGTAMSCIDDGTF
ncbi:hypothetical protein BKA64DRAFT_102377 [Cadophora sp. MPI-SDFR-AT-0126]|nr:hypothetical protein BKA64DRAFT_102377 [Leotiomycetes sp. MPI-SDFR-AT-0126]